MERLRVSSILDMAYLAKRIVAGERTPEEFFRIWPDLSQEEERDVVDLWYDVQYLENDSVIGDASNVEFYRQKIFQIADRLEERFRVKWRSPKEG
jgi:hypothetical protein